jgi:isopentenyl diphosphate isomerase/L-lactate dehydrogenase-like FMN-dependent dehydrogenase
MIPAALERQARALLRPEVYAFYAGGSGREVTLRANVKAWGRVPLLPRVLRDVSAVDSSVRVLGPELATPSPALGARAVFVGRPVLWALAYGGAEGVRSLLSNLAAGFAHAMALAGAATVADLEGVAAPAFPAGAAVPPDGAASQRWSEPRPGNSVGV